MNHPIASMQGKRPHQTRRVYYIGTDTIVAGYVLCYDQNATKNADPEEEGLGIAVEKPATANLNHFAGIVAPGQSVTGPGWVEIVTEGLVEAFTDADMTLGTSILGPVNDSYALAAKSLSDPNTHAEHLQAVAQAWETVDTDTNNANALVRLIGVH
jgi:hypothetical protein